MSSIQSSIASYPVHILPIVYIFPSMHIYLPSVYIQTILFLNDSVIIALLQTPQVTSLYFCIIFIIIMIVLLFLRVYIFIIVLLL